MISFWKMIGGFCRIQISGTGKERFLNLCKNRRILIWNLVRNQDGYTFYVSYKAYKMLEEISDKSNTHIKIEGKYGLPFFLYRYKKRTMFFTGIAICMFLIFFLSFFIWDIQIEGTEQYSEDELRSYLSEQGIELGVMKNKINCAILEENIREDFEYTAWVSCDIEGTLLTVQVKESINSNDSLNARHESANDIIAAKDGIIESIITRTGTPLVKQGTEVKKGDTLISGIIYYYNDYDELLETSKSSADGDVKAKTVYEYRETFPLSYYEKAYTGNNSKEYILFLGNKSFVPIGNSSTYKNYDTVTETRRLRLSPFFYLPISVQVKKHMEYEPNQVVLTEKTAKEKAKQKTEYYLDQLKQEGKEIVEKNFQIHIIDNECVIKGTVTVIESIGKIRNIP